MKCTQPGVGRLRGSWFGDWLREYGAEVVEVRVPYDEAVEAADVRQALEGQP